MNKKGGLFISVIIAFVILISGFIFLNYIDPEVEGAQNETNYDLPGLNCGNTTAPNQNISDGSKVTCLIVDATEPYFIIIIIMAASGIIVGRFLIGK